jgi:glycosyltransferase involved in cell wall biosynthesis
VRVLIVNQFFDPDPAATAVAATHLARRMVARGHRVTVLASRYSHIMKGARLPDRETIEGVEIRRVGGTNFGRGSLLGRIVDAGTFYALLGLRALTAPKFDGLLVMSSPPLIETIGPIVGALRGVWVGCWLMDMNPDITVGMGVIPERSPLMRACALAGRWAMRRMDKVIAIGGCMADRVARRGVERERIASIETGADPDELRPLEHDRNEWRRAQGLAPGRPVVMYSGNFGTGHPMQDFFAAFRRLLPTPDADPGFDIYMIGGGVRRREAEEFAREVRNPRFHLLPYQPLDVLNQSLAAGDVHLISQAPNMVGAYIPSKVYGVMGVGRPFVFVGPREATVGRIADEGACGVVVRPGDVDGLIDAIQSLLSEKPRREALGSAGRRLLETKYARTLCEDRLVDLVEEELAARGVARPQISQGVARRDDRPAPVTQGAA